MYSHTIAECLSALVSEATRRAKAPRLVVAIWDDAEGSETTLTDGPWSFARTFAAADPFQSGDYCTLPLWYVQRQLAIVLGTPAIERALTGTGAA